MGTGAANIGLFWFSDGCPSRTYHCVLTYARAKNVLYSIRTTRDFLVVPGTTTRDY